MYAGLHHFGVRDITIIDDDLGISGAGVHRPGFDALLEAVCKGRVGLVLSIEASRLSRNGREWHTLLDFCAIVGCLVGDRDRLYDPALIDDRMYLGLKGQFNEMELALFRQRSLESRMAMAQRGELWTTLPAGYDKVERHRIEMTADQRQRDAIHLVFRKFRELGSIRQVFFWFQRHSVELPARTPGQGLVWRVPVSSRRVAQILTNPIYAGAYAYGRSRQETVLDKGRRRVRRSIAKQDPQQWTVLLREHHDGYITWGQFERNQELLAENMTTVRGAVRNGPELLAGLLRCGHCENRIQVRDSGKAIVYRCQGLRNRERANCISFGAVRVDAAVGTAVMDTLQPLGIEAALASSARLTGACAARSSPRCSRGSPTTPPRCGTGRRPEHPCEAAWSSVTNRGHRAATTTTARDRSWCTPPPPSRASSPPKRSSHASSTNASRTR